MKSTTKRIGLDWGKLLGFSQVKSLQNNSGNQVARAAIGVKIGVKAGLKPGGGGGAAA
jgi:hypothetical protein